MPRGQSPWSTALSGLDAHQKPLPGLVCSDAPLAQSSPKHRHPPTQSFIRAGWVNHDKDFKWHLVLSPACPLCNHASESQVHIQCADQSAPCALVLLDAYVAFTSCIRWKRPDAWVVHCGRRVLYCLYMLEFTRPSDWADDWQTRTDAYKTER